MSATSDSDRSGEAAHGSPEYPPICRPALDSPPWGDSTERTHSSSASPTSVRSHGRSRGALPPRERSSPSRSRASESRETCASSPLRRLRARHRVRRSRRRRHRARLQGDRRSVGREARHARALGRVRCRRGSRGPVHGYTPRPFLDGGRHQRLFARRGGARRGAFDDRRRRRVDRDDDLSRGRARGSALQRDGCREGDAGRVRQVPRLGSRREGDPGQRRSRPAQCARSPPARSLASPRWSRCSWSALRCVVTSTPTTSRRPRPTSSPTRRRTSPGRRCTSTPGITRWACRDVSLLRRVRRQRVRGSSRQARSLAYDHGLPRRVR